MENLLGVIGFFSMLGLLALLLAFLNLRDQRKSVLYGVVFGELNSPDLRGLFTVKVRYGLFSRQAIVTIEMWHCSNKQIWDTIMRLSIKLPPHVWLTVNGSAALRTPSSWHLPNFWFAKEAG
jgi:hypothetical protein